MSRFLGGVPTTQLAGRSPGACFATSFAAFSSRGSGIARSMIGLCKCGHHVDTHFERGNCLGMRCECKFYDDSESPVPVVFVRPSKHPEKCRCYYCEGARRQAEESRYPRVVLPNRIY